jgi:hypothetical protein
MEKTAVQQIRQGQSEEGSVYHCSCGMMKKADLSLSSALKGVASGRGVYGGEPASTKRVKRWAREAKPGVEGVKSGVGMFGGAFKKASAGFEKGEAVQNRGKEKEGAAAILQKLAQEPVNIDRGDLQEAMEEAKAREDIAGSAQRGGLLGAGIGGVGGAGLGAGLGYGASLLAGAAPGGVGRKVGLLAGGLLGGVGGGLGGQQIGSQMGAQEAAADKLVSMMRNIRAYRSGAQQGFMAGAQRGFAAGQSSGQ